MLDRIARRLYLPLAGMVKGQNVPEKLRTLNESQYWTPEKLKTYQWAKVLRIIKYAERNIPYYAKKWNREGVSADDVLTENQFRKLPILTKKEVQENRHSICYSGYSGRVIWGRTSGSTGTPLEIAYTTDYLDWTQAAQWRARGWFGVQRGERVLALWGRPFYSAMERYKNTLKNRFQNIMVIQPFELTEEELRHAWRRANRFKPSMIYGYAASISRFTGLLKKWGKKIRFPVKCVYSAGETLYEHQRKMISEVFSCPVLNEFGSSEVGAFAFECEHGNMHISDENVYIEFVRENGKPARAGEEARIVATVLSNDYMPLIRYDMGDIGSWKRNKCPCGRGLSTMDLVAGKITEILRTPSGKSFSSHIFNYINHVLMVKKAKGIRQFRIIQKELGRFVVQVETDDGFSERTLDLFRDVMIEKLGDDVEIEFEQVEEIVPDPTGKVRYFISEVGG